MSAKSDPPQTAVSSDPSAPSKVTVELDTVRKSARLARLAVSDEQLVSYQEHFARLLAFVEDVTSAPIDDVEPMAHPMDMVQRLRPDAVTCEDQRDALQASGPKTEDGFYLVPRVIE